MAQASIRPRSIDTPTPTRPNYFLDWAFEEMQRLMRGKKDEYNLIARTTVDIRLAEGRRAGRRDDARAERQGACNFDQAALVSMEIDGAVRAMVGGQDYGESQFNRATNALRQPGSSFKTYVYLTALENGVTPNRVASDGPVSCGNWSPKQLLGRLSRPHDADAPRWPSRSTPSR